MYNTNQKNQPVQQLFLKKYEKTSKMTKMAVNIEVVLWDIADFRFAEKDPTGGIRKGLWG